MFFNRVEYMGDFEAIFSGVVESTVQYHTFEGHVLTNTAKTY